MISVYLLLDLYYRFVLEINVLLLGFSQYYTVEI